MTDSIALPGLHATAECAAALLPWRNPAGPRLTIVVKLTFALGEGLIRDLSPPVDVTPRDLHLDRSPLRALELVGDMAPALPRAEVVLVGSAFAAGGLAAPAVSAQLQVARGDVLLRKKVHVLGNRARHGDSPEPFRSMPITWERAIKSKDNPIGVEAKAGAPNWVDPEDPARAACFAPLAANWPVRRHKRGKVSSSLLDAEVPDIPAGFDWTYFQSAVTDQQLDRLVGDEWIALDGLHPVLPRLSFQLPQRRVTARFVDPAGKEVEVRDLAPDRLFIDTDRQRATLTHRGVLAADPAQLAGFRIDIGSAPFGAPMVFPDPADPSTVRGARRPSPQSRRIPLSGTMSVEVSHAARSATPFAEGEEPTSAGPAHWGFEDPSETVNRELPGSIRTGTVVFPVPSGPAPSPPKQWNIGVPDDTITVDAPALPSGRGALPFGIPPSKLTGPAPVAPSAPAPPPSASVAAPPPVARPPMAAPPPPPFAGPPGSFPGEADEEPGHTRAIDVSALMEAPTPFADRGPDPRRATGEVAVLEGLPFQRGDGGEDTPPVLVPEVVAPVAETETRRGEMIPSLTDAPFSVANITFQLVPPQEQLVVIVKASFLLTPGQVAPLAEEAALPVGDAFAEDDLDGALVQASDFAVIKPKVDLLVQGHAHAPGGKPTTAMQVAVRLRGDKIRYERALAVFGDRTWQRALVALAPTAPEPFTSIPIAWERSFGGPAVRENPVGAGRGATRLPNFELQEKLIKAPDDAPPPAGLGPIHPLWPARWSRLGTYDIAWVRSRWPYFAADFDPLYFQAAPPAQQLDVLVGDEEYELTGLHPTHGSIHGRLPGVKPRAFAQLTVGAGSRFVEIPLRLDTLTFTPDADLGHLVWRGRFDVSDDDAPEIETVFVTSEPVKGPKLSMDEARARYLALLEEDQEEESAPPELEPAKAEPTEEELADEAAIREIEDKIAKHEAEVKVMTPDPPPGTPDPLPPVDPEQVVRTLREAGLGEEDIAELRAALEPAVETEPPEAPPTDLRAFVLDRIARQEPLADLDLREADLTDLDLQKQCFAGSDMSGARFDRANLTGCELTGARLLRASFADAKLAGITLDGCDLTATDFTGADLEGASMVGVEGEDVKLVGANLRGAVLTDGTLENSDWSNAIALELDAEDLDLTGAKLNGARFDDAKLVKIRLYEATGTGASFDRADMTNARVDSATLTSSSFREVTARESIWELAVLTRSTFQGAELVESSFTRATCWKANFNECDLLNARLRKSKMNGATFVKANLMEAALDRADLELADLRGANLHGAFIHRTELKHARTDHAILTQSALGRKQG